MTDIADLEGLFEPVDEGWPPVVEREPMKCVRHRWVAWIDPEIGPAHKCRRCNIARDDTRVRRGRTSRNRGNAFEREVAAKLGGRRVGQFGDKVDVEVPGWLRVQCKNGGTYPERLDGWLRAIPFQADLLRAVVLGDAPGSAGKRRSLIVLDLDEFASWYASGRKEP